MALPTILFNSSTGSDSAASGAGPGTALTGSSASTSASGLVVTLDGSPDLSGVATDGSHVIYLADTTAGARNFGKITAVDNGADTVTVSDAFGVSLTGKSWAIGGKRLTISGTDSSKLIANNGSSGDAMPGWILEMESGFTDTITANLRFRRAGDLVDGPIILRGTYGAATKPILTADFNGTMFTSGTGNYHQFWDFTVKNTNATKTASAVFGSGSGGDSCYIRRITCSDPTDYFGRFASTNVNDWCIEECDIGYCSLSGAITLSGVRGRIKHCYFHHLGSDAILTASTHGVAQITGNLFNNIAGNAIQIAAAGSSGGMGSITHNTMYDIGDDAIDVSSTSNQLRSLLIENNIISSVTGYGLNFSGASVDKYDLMAYATLIRNNVFHSCSSGSVNPANVADVAEGTMTTDPGFTNAAGGDFSIGTALKAAGFSGIVIPGSATRSYIDPGAAQREEPAGGGLLVHPGMTGGMRG